MGALLGGCGSTDYERLQGQTMGTYFLVQYGPTPSCHPTLLSVEEQLVVLNDAFSTYQPDSELSRLNLTAAGRPVTLSPLLGKVLGEAYRVWQLSGGAFDVTVGPLVNLWGFGPDDRPHTPDEREQAQTAHLVGMDKLVIDFDVIPMQVVKSHSAQYIDLSALAKGYAVDVLAERLEQLGCINYMVDIGGEIRVRGSNPKGVAWRIGIERPDASDAGQINTVLALVDEAVATSGDYRNFKVVNGRRVDHVVDPRTAKPSTSPVVSATVIAASAMTADAFATTLMVLDPAAGLALADRAGLAVYLLVADEMTSGESGDVTTFTARYNNAMSRYLSK